MTHEAKNNEDLTVIHNSIELKRQSKCIALAIGLIILLTGCDDSMIIGQASVHERTLLSMNRHAHSLLRDPKSHAVSIGILRDGKSYTRHFGEIDPGKDNKPTNKTIYEIASVSKTFAGILVAQAELSSLLNLNDDIRKYLPDDFPNLEFDGQAMTIKHLVTHTSGLPKFLPTAINDQFANIDEQLPLRIHEIESSYDKRKFFADLKQVKITSVPGTVYAYSNADTELLAYILENVYQKSYEDILRTVILSKADMPNTRIRLTGMQNALLANGYGEKNMQVPHMSNPLWGAGGGIKSTMPDLINYMKFQLDEANPVVAKSHTQLFENEYIRMGYYWPIHENADNGIFYQHHGGAFGTQNWFILIPKLKLGLSIVTNQSDMETAEKLLDVSNQILHDIR